LRLQGIPGILMQKVLLKGATGVVVEPVKTKISQLGNAALNTLIQLDDIEFRDASPTTTYAINNPLNPLTLNHTLVDCEQGQITLRNSGYASFAGAVVPETTEVSLEFILFLVIQNKYLSEIRQTLFLIKNDVVKEKGIRSASGN
jgi:hypothetical protein